MSVDVILNQLRAEIILNGSWILTEIRRFSQGLSYEDGEAVISYKTYFNSLLDEVEQIPSITLLPVIAPGTSRAYLIDLTCGLEQVLDRIEVTHNRVLFFQSKVKSAGMALKTLRDTFKAWYMIGLQDELKRFEIKLANKALDSLSDSEFNRILGDAGSDLEALDMALGILADRLKSRKKLAQEKYTIGKDQANASLLPFLGPQAGYSDEKTGEELLRSKYGLGERKNMVLDDPPEEFMVRRRRAEPEPEMDEPPLRIATKASMTKQVTGVVNYPVETVSLVNEQGEEIPWSEPTSSKSNIEIEVVHEGVWMVQEPDGFLIHEEPSEMVLNVQAIQTGVNTNRDSFQGKPQVEITYEPVEIIDESKPTRGKSKRVLMFDDEVNLPNSVSPVEAPKLERSEPDQIEKPITKQRRIIFED